MADVFTSHLEWTGAPTGPTNNVTSYRRDLDVSVAGSTVPMSAAPRSGGDVSRANPEQLLVAALSTCQALTYLFVAEKHGVPVAGYSDDADGHLTVVDGRIRMGRVTLPRVSRWSHGNTNSRRTHWWTRRTVSASSPTRCRCGSTLSRRLCWPKRCRDMAADVSARELFDVMAVGAHPDDVEIAMGAPLSR